MIRLKNLVFVQIFSGSFNSSIEGFCYWNLLLFWFHPPRESKKSLYCLWVGFAILFVMTQIFLINHMEFLLSKNDLAITTNKSVFQIYEILSPKHTLDFYVLDFAGRIGQAYWSCRGDKCAGKLVFIFSWPFIIMVWMLFSPNFFSSIRLERLVKVKITCTNEKGGGAKETGCAFKWCFYESFDQQWANSKPSIFSPFIDVWFQMLINNNKIFFWKPSYFGQCILVSEEDELPTFVDKPNRGKCVLVLCTSFSGSF